MPTPQCPRCGYDQSGETARWSDQCPLEGLCSECGLAFEWANAFNPDRERLKGFFEHTRGLVRSFLAAWRTWWWALLPWRFWKRVRLEHRIYPWHILAWPLILMTPLKLIAAAALCFGFAIAFQTRPLGAVPPPGLNYIYLEAFIEPIAHVRLGGGGALIGVALFDDLEDIIPPFGLPVLAGMLACPLALLVLPHTRAMARVRAAHVTRAWAYSLAPLVFLGIAHAVDRVITGMRLAGLGSMPPFGGPGLINHYEFNATHGFITFVSLAWIGVWWLCALKLGFRMNRALWPLVSMGVIALLAALIGAVIDPRVAETLFA